jgi:hypothetical protein
MTEYTTKFDLINKYLVIYLIYVAKKEEYIFNEFDFAYDDDDETSREEFTDVFCFKAVNNYEKGYSFVSYLREIGAYDKLKHKLNSDFMFYIIKMINTFYETEYGIESIMDYKKISFEFILHHYAYYFVYSDMDNTRYEIDRKIRLLIDDYNKSDEDTECESDSDE